MPYVCGGRTLYGIRDKDKHAIVFVTFIISKYIMDIISKYIMDIS